MWYFYFLFFHQSQASPLFPTQGGALPLLGVTSLCILPEPGPEAVSSLAPSDPQFRSYPELALLVLDSYFPTSTEVYLKNF